MTILAFVAGQVSQNIQEDPYSTRSCTLPNRVRMWYRSAGYVACRDGMPRELRDSCTIIIPHPIKSRVLLSCTVDSVPSQSAPIKGRDRKDPAGRGARSKFGRFDFVHVQPPKNTVPVQPPTKDKDPMVGTVQKMVPRLVRAKAT